MLKLTVTLLRVLFVFSCLMLIAPLTRAVDNNTPEYEAYVVQEHQSIASIAAEYAMPAADLARYNALRPSDPLTAGQILFIPIFPKAPGEPVLTQPKRVVRTIVPKAGASPNWAGTGFVVNANGYLVTCYHIVEDAAYLRVIMQGAQYQATVVSSDKMNDLALLKIQATKLTALSMADGAAVKKGTNLRIFGYPLTNLTGTDLKVVSGMISGTATIGGQVVWQTDAAMNPGNSGGPATDRSGALLGVASFGVKPEMATGMNFLLRVQQVKQLLKKAGVKYVDARKYTELPDVQLVERISPGVALILAWDNDSVEIQTIPSTIPEQISNASADVPKGTLPGTTATVTTKQVSGTFARVSAQFAQIRTRPQGGQILFDKSPKGTELLVIEETATHYGVLMADGSTGWVERLAITLTDITMVVDRPDSKSTVESRQDIVDTAMEYLGIPYKYGGALPENVDDSLLVQAVFARHGVKLPRTAAQQFDVGTPIEVQQLIPGDRLYYYDRDSARIGHTGIYIGNSRFVHASSTRGMVAIDEFTNQVYMKLFAGARR